MKCIVKNKQCVDGWILINGHNMGRCQCVKVKAVHKAYHNWGRFDPEMKHPFKKLVPNKAREYQYFSGKTGNTMNHLELGKKMVEHFPDMLEKRAKVLLYGHTGTGKSQFVSSLAYEIAFYHEVCSYYLKARDFYEAVFDYGDPLKKKWNFIQDRVLDPATKVLIIDDLGSELAKGGDNRTYELITRLNNLIREFQERKREYVILLTSNLTPEKLYSCYNEDDRLFDVLFQEGKTKFYEISAAQKFRHSKKDELSFLD